MLESFHWWWSYIISTNQRLKINVCIACMAQSCPLCIVQLCLFLRLNKFSRLITYIRFCEKHKNKTPQKFPHYRFILCTTFSLMFLEFRFLLCTLSFPRGCQCCWVPSHWLHPTAGGDDWSRCESGLQGQACCQRGQSSFQGHHLLTPVT